MCVAVRVRLSESVCAVGKSVCLSESLSLIEAETIPSCGQRCWAWPRATHEGKCVSVCVCVRAPVSLQQRRVLDKGSTGVYSRGWVEKAVLL